MFDTFAKMAENLRPVKWEGPITCTAEPLGAPITSQAVCGGAVGGGWKCQRCGQCAEFGSYPGVCPDCSRRTTIIRVRRTARVTCQCHIPAQVQDELDRKEHQRREKAEREREWALARRMQDAQMAEDRRKAAECLVGFNGNCTARRPPGHPFAYCLACTVNTKAAR